MRQCTSGIGRKNLLHLYFIHILPVAAAVADAILSVA
jgi:hypothetical protein